MAVTHPLRVEVSNLSCDQQPGSFLHISPVVFKPVTGLSVGDVSLGLGAVSDFSLIFPPLCSLSTGDYHMIPLAAKTWQADSPFSTGFRAFCVERETPLTEMFDSCLVQELMWCETSVVY